MEVYIYYIYDFFFLHIKYMEDLYIVYIGKHNKFQCETHLEPSRYIKVLSLCLSLIRPISTISMERACEYSRYE